MNILELGSGTSLPSVSCCIKSKDSVIVTTDISETYELREKIISDNNYMFKGKMHNLNLDYQKPQDRAAVDEIFKATGKGIDYIICSELIYIDDLFDPLISTIKYFCSENTKVILTYRIRLPEQVEDFMKKFTVYFDYKEIDIKELDKFQYKKKMVVLEAKAK